MRSKVIVRYLAKITMPVMVLLALFIFVSNYCINDYARDYIFDTIDLLPENEVGLLLGTSRLTSRGTKNLYFDERIDAAVKLFQAKKIRTIIVSGDNRHKSYNEPRDMRRELIKKGIPEKSIVFDFAGRRTLDSVVRAKMIFDQDSFTIISQKFQNERAVYIARHYGADAVAFNAEGEADLKMNMREYFSRAKCIIDVLVLKTMPQIMGDKVFIPKSVQNNDSEGPDRYRVFQKSSDNF
jgi:SanA protein